MPTRINSSRWTRPHISLLAQALRLSSSPQTTWFCVLVPKIDPPNAFQEERFYISLEWITREEFLSQSCGCCCWFYNWCTWGRETQVVVGGLVGRWLFLLLLWLLVVSSSLRNGALSINEWQHQQQHEWCELFCLAGTYMGIIRAQAQCSVCGAVVESVQDDGDDQGN